MENDQTPDTTYIRADDKAVMIRVAPHQFVNKDVLDKLGRAPIAPTLKP